MENEFEPTRGMLGERMQRRAPADLTDKVMQEVLRLEQRRIYRRVILAMTLRSAVFVAILLLLLLPVISGGVRGDAIWKGVEALKQGGAWLKGNIYFLMPLIALLFVRRMFAIK